MLDYITYTTTIKTLQHLIGSRKYSAHLAFCVWASFLIPLSSVVTFVVAIIISAFIVRLIHNKDKCIVYTLMGFNSMKSIPDVNSLMSIRLLNHSWSELIKESLILNRGGSTSV